MHRESYADAEETPPLTRRTPDYMTGTCGSFERARHALRDNRLHRDDNGELWQMGSPGRVVDQHFRPRRRRSYAETDSSFMVCISVKTFKQ